MDRGVFYANTETRDARQHTDGGGAPGPGFRRAEQRRADERQTTEAVHTDETGLATVSETKLERLKREVGDGGNGRRRVADNAENEKDAQREPKLGMRHLWRRWQRQRLRHSTQRAIHTPQPPWAPLSPCAGTHHH